MSHSIPRGARAVKGGGSPEFEDILPGGQDQAPGNENHLLIRAASGGRRERSPDLIRDPDSDHGDTAVRKFPEIRASVAGNRVSPPFMRVRSEAAVKNRG